MYGTEVYDKVYFRDDYQGQFEAFRSRYHGRVQEALAGRAVDSAPMPNATTYIALHELEDGGVTIASSGDFLDYFNHRYGGRDRIGACRAALATAAQKAEKSALPARERADAVGGAISCRMRCSRSHLMLVNVMFTLLLVLSLVLLGASGVMLRNSERALAVAEAEALYLDTAGTEVMLSDSRSAVVNADYLAYSRENTATAYEVEEQGFFAALQNAFSYLW